MSNDFKQWALLTVLGTVFSELLVFFMFTPETRHDPIVQGLMWLFLPTPAIMCALLIKATPSK